jgi:Dehydrogenases with different specificities (related to short-chain alcohol dehydrogenases)
MKLNNKVAIITGTASGMGRSMAILFAKNGAKVIACDIADQTGDADFASAGEVITQKLDVSNRAAVEAVIDFAVEKYGKLDILVNNAGIMDNMMPVSEVSDALWEKVLQINLNGVMYACRKAIVQMEAQGSGVIINTASAGGLLGCRAGAAYTASKFAVVGLSKNIGYMYAQKGIRCNAICPGAVETNIASSMRQPSEFGAARAMSGMGTNPRTGSADEIAAVALFLASDESSFVNGATIAVDGGWSAY